MILGPDGKPTSSPSRLNLDSINRIVEQQLREHLDAAMFRRITTLYGPDGKMVYTDLGFGLKGLQDVVETGGPAWGGNIQAPLSYAPT